MVGWRWEGLGAGVFGIWCHLHYSLFIQCKIEDISVRILCTNVEFTEAIISLRYDVFPLLTCLLTRI